ncbi:hypothetical protein BFW01_g5052 [Lasiodiplodia theobromae]|nr:hypothetical protein BFW01_g5052 [Lasiodiplodia theobromae]
MDRLLDLASSQNVVTHHSVIHSMLVADSIKGWMSYIAWLEQDLKEKSDHITLTNLGVGVKDFTFSVEDRQSLKMVEDAVIDLQTVTSTMLSTVKGISRYCGKCCKACCKRKPQKSCICSAVLEEFHGHVSEIELIINRAQSLRDRVVSSIQLLSDLLRYEDQRALKDLTEQSAAENSTMLSLAVQISVKL